MRLPSTTFLALAGALHMAAAVHGMATETVMAGSSRSLLLMPIVDSTQAVESASAVIKDGQFATVAASSFATNVTLAIEGLKPGTTLVDITLTPAHAESFEGPTTISVLVEVVRSYALIPVTSALGWLCFILWSFSFYPQILENHRRNSVVGLNLDSTAWNLVGNMSYLAYNAPMYFSAAVLALYQSEHPASPNPVTLSDLFFALHATALTAYTLSQAFTLDRGSQFISKPTIFGIMALTLAFMVAGGLSSGGHISTLRYLEALSTVKLVCTFLRYTPQVVFNWRRQSTEGFAVETQLLDIVGGGASVLQMYLQAYNSDNFGVFGNFAKFGLALVSIGFDLTLLFQHYVLYRHTRPRRFAHYTYGDMAAGMEKDAAKPLLTPQLSQMLHVPAEAGVLEPMVSVVPSTYRAC